MIDTAFFDRFHHYLPGWEVPKMRPEFFTNEYGFITDFMAEWMRELQKYNFSNAIDKYFKLGRDLNQRDTKAVKKTVSGLLKLLFPDENYTKEDVRVALEYALVGRRRIKEQLKKIGGMEFYDVNFSYIDLENNDEIRVNVPESGGNSLIPDGTLPNGSLYTVATNPDTSHKGLFRFDLQTMSGNGKLDNAGFSSSSDVKEEIKEAGKKEMWISYADTGNEGRYLYIVRGYGRQETTGYSIEVNECYETEHTVVVRTTLLGPQKKEKTHKKKTYPYIVIKIPYTDKQIIYE